MVSEKQQNNANIDTKELSDYLFAVSTTLMGAGAHTGRVIRNTTRIAQAFGYNIDITIFTKTIMLTMRKNDDNTISHTSIRKIPHSAINFQIISEISTLSWKAYDNKLSLDKLREAYDLIVSKPRLSRWVVLILVSFANTAFCRLFDGDIYSMGLVFIATFIAFLVRQELMNRYVNHNTIFVICAFLASMIASVGMRFDIGATPEIALGSSILFLIPGVPLINSIIDLLGGYVLLGIARAVNAFMLVISISIGLAITIMTMNLGF